jgi:hypothetical protein
MAPPAPKRRNRGQRLGTAITKSLRDPAHGRLQLMERKALQSRAIVAAGYDPASRTLELEFASGRIYRYSDVPAGTYEWLLRAPSKGGYFARMINERYAYSDVTAPLADARDLGEALLESLRKPPRDQPE